MSPCFHPIKICTHGIYFDRDSSITSTSISAWAASNLFFPVSPEVIFYYCRKTNLYLLRRVRLHLRPFQSTETLKWLAILITVCARKSIRFQLDFSNQAIIVCLKTYSEALLSPIITLFLLSRALSTFLFGCVVCITKYSFGKMSESISFN